MEGGSEGRREGGSNRWTDGKGILITFAIHIGPLLESLLHSNRVEKTGCVFNSEKTQWVHRAIYTSQIGLYICVIDHKLVHIL